MIYQLHHQNIEDRHKTEFCSQKDIQSNEELQEWCNDVQKEFPLPKGFDWLLCNEKSEYFMSCPIGG
jgi:hypothetical protein